MEKERKAIKTSSYSDKYAQCPFYGHDEKQKIACNEGTEEDNFIHLVFGQSELKKEYRMRRCDSEYEKCPIYKMLYDKYT
jgi:hypothetical protein